MHTVVVTYLPCRFSIQVLSLKTHKQNRQSLLIFKPDNFPPLNLFSQIRAQCIIYQLWHVFLLIPPVMFYSLLALAVTITIAVRIHYQYSEMFPGSYGANLMKVTTEI